MIMIGSVLRVCVWGKDYDSSVMLVCLWEKDYDSSAMIVCVSEKNYDSSVMIVFFINVYQIKKFNIFVLINHITFHKYLLPYLSYLPCLFHKSLCFALFFVVFTHYT